MFKLEKKSRNSLVMAAIAFCIMACCFQIPVFSKSAKATITAGKEYYREFLVDNVLHSPENGDIHYHVYFPDSYDGKKKMALYVTLPGYQGLYFQGVAENLKTEDFAFEAKKYNKDMVILAPQLDDWGETSAEQTIALVEYFLDNYPIDPAKVFINGYSGGGETLSLVLGKRPELFARALMCSSQWDGDYEPVVKARTPVYFVIGESDEYYSSKPFRAAYKKLQGLYQKEGLPKKEIKKLLVLDVKGSSYFKGTGITYQHGGGWLFCRDKKIMNWLFAPAQEKAKGNTVKLKAALNKAAKKNGKATITARIKRTKVKASSRITVDTPVRRITLNRKSVSLKTGQKFTLKTTISPKKAAVKKVSCKSSNGGAWE